MSWGSSSHLPRFEHFVLWRSSSCTPYGDKPQRFRWSSLSWKVSLKHSNFCFRNQSMKAQICQKLRHHSAYWGCMSHKHCLGSRTHRSASSTCCFVSHSSTTLTSRAGWSSCHCLRRRSSSHRCDPTQVQTTRIRHLSPRCHLPSLPPLLR